MHSKSNLIFIVKLRRVVLLLAFFIFSSTSLTQRGLSNQSFFNNNLGLYNPSLLGGIRKMNTNIFFKMGDLGTEYRNYFAGFNFEYSLKRNHNFGLGAMTQRESDWLNSKVFIGYSYKLDIKDSDWSIGLGVNVGFKSLNHSSYLDPLPPLDTAIYAHSNPDQIQVYTSAGINVWWRDRVFLSLSSSDIVAYSNYKSENNNYDQEKGLNNVPGLTIGIGTRNPAFGDSLIKKTSFEANFLYNLQFKGTLSGRVEINFGLNIWNIINPKIGFRWLNDYYITLGLQGRLFKGLYVSYAYDIGIDRVSTNITGKGSHEFGLGYFIPHKVRSFSGVKKKKNKKK